MDHKSSKAQQIIFNVKKVYWENIREKIHSINKELADICDKINPDKKYPLYKIKYPYGAKIVESGIFNLPIIDGQVISIKDNRIPFDLANSLDYCPIPLALIIHNNNEVYVESQNRIIPLNFFKVGDLFGVFENMNYLAGVHSDPIWNVTAGGRSVFMVPKITDKMGHRRIKKEFGISNDIPTDLNTHWEIFKKISQANDDSTAWYNEILIFDKEWFSQKVEDTQWLEFNNYLFKISWKQSKLLRDAIEFGLLWATFGEIVSKRSLKPRAYIVDTLKHLISIGNGSGVAFKPATDEEALPLALIQKIYIEIYNLKTYIPTIMQPCKLNDQDQYAYYSLAFPTTLETSPYMKNAPSLIEDQRDIKILLDILLKLLEHKTTVINPIKGINYDFFHTDIDPYGEIYASQKLVKEDSRFKQSTLTQSTDRSFCTKSHFFRGCIRISSKNQQ